MNDEHRFHPSILREYDIRGILEETLFETDAYAIGRSFGTVLRQDSPNPKMAVGYDGRISSPGLKTALIKGLTESGVEVLDIGLGPTPMLYFAVCSLNLDGGIMVTGSHNPPTHNGFKLMRGRKPFFGADIKQLGEIAASGNYAKGEGTAREQSVRESYINQLVSAFTARSGIKAVWDAGNGAAGEIMRELSARLPGEHSTLFAEIDGNFPNHHPDPSVAENMRDAIHSVLEVGADVGLAFDGDGDRLGVVDETGRILWGDELIAVLATEVLSERPGATIIADVKASQGLFDSIAQQGGKPLMWKTGHSHIKIKMAEEKAPLAGEMSGHIFFADKNFGYDDGLYAAVRLINLLAASGRKLSSFKGLMPESVSTPEIRFACDDARKFAVIDEGRARIEKDGARFSGIDGVRVNTPDGWWLLRASNTQAVLVARCESGKGEAGLEVLKNSLARQLELSGVALPEKSDPH